MPQQTKRSPRRDARFFDALENTGSPASAARTAGYPRSTVYHRRRVEAGFGARWDEALALYVESLESALDRRGFEGADEPVIYQGKVQYQRDEEGALVLDEAGDPRPLTVRRFDTRAAIFRLQSLRPDRYARRADGPEIAPDADPHIGAVFDFEAIRKGAGPYAIEQSSRQEVEDEIVETDAGGAPRAGGR